MILVAPYTPEATGGGGGDGVTIVSAPLTGLDDSRGPAGAFCYYANGDLYFKVSVSPHTWVAWSTFNS